MSEALKRQPPTPAEVQERLTRMYGAVVPEKGTAVATTGPDPYGAYASTAAGKFMKFSKGDFLAGSEGQVIPDGTQFIANMAGLQVGWQKWVDGKPADSILGLLAENFRPPPLRDLPDRDETLWPIDDRTGERRDPWQFVNLLPLKSVETGEQFCFSTTSKGGLDAVRALCGQHSKALKTKPGTLPVIALGQDSYPHPNKSFGRIKYPVFIEVGRTSDGVDKETLADDMDDEVPFNL
jgi:hypothetical protein